MTAAARKAARRTLAAILGVAAAGAAADSNDLLTAAVEYGDLETVRALLADGDDANKTTEDSDSMLRLAGKEGHREIGALLFHHAQRSMAC